MSENCCTTKKKKRTEEEYKKLINRLNRIEGQIRGIRKMVENDAYCTDVLVQSLAASSAIDAFNKELLTSHFKSCVVDDIRNNDEQGIEEFTDIMRRLMR
ncbi:MAG: metal-sensing transcriptional repressor [Erysipelotrichaceae bacterium]|nr:metal-sensing transcriptional repressor [Erysipelotrichaceae bacterium]